MGCSIKADVLDKKRMIDQHYYAISSKATSLKPEQVNVPGDKFQARFGLSWKDALASRGSPRPWMGVPYLPRPRLPEAREVRRRLLLWLG